LPKDFKVQDGGSIASVDALAKVYGTKYQHGNIALDFYILLFYIQIIFND
jgi:hypothetical protein